MKKKKKKVDTIQFFRIEIKNIQQTSSKVKQKVLVSVHAAIF